VSILVRLHHTDRTAEAQCVTSYVYRFPLINNGVLVEALQAGTIADAGLNVFVPEPLPPDHPLLALDNMLVGPHIAGVTSVSMSKLAHGAVQQVLMAPLP
jgi:D-3-phosphoglycerate dehydrogenase